MQNPVTPATVRGGFFYSRPYDSNYLVKTACSVACNTGMLSHIASGSKAFRHGTRRSLIMGLGQNCLKTSSISCAQGKRVGSLMVGRRITRQVKGQFAADVGCVPHVETGIRLKATPRYWRLHEVEPRSLTSVPFVSLIRVRDPPFLPYASAGGHGKWNTPGLSRRSKVCAPNRSRCAWMRLAGRRARR